MPVPGVVQVEALEGTEEPVGISHVEPTTIVSYQIFSRFTGSVGHPELNSRLIYPGV
jgi:hypothetical protein